MTATDRPPRLLLDEARRRMLEVPLHEHLAEIRQLHNSELGQGRAQVDSPIHRSGIPGEPDRHLIRMT